MTRDQQSDDDHDHEGQGEALLTRLHALPRPQPSAMASARSLRRARQTFLTSTPPARPGMAAQVTAHLMRLYARAEPALAATLVLAYLGWALEAVRTITR